MKLFKIFPIFMIPIVFFYCQSSTTGSLRTSSCVKLDSEIDDSQQPDIEVAGYEEDTLIVGVNPEVNSISDTVKVAQILKKVTGAKYTIERIHKVEKVEIELVYDEKTGKYKKVKKVKPLTDKDYDKLPIKEKRLFASYKIKIKKEKKLKIKKLMKDLKKDVEVEYAQKNLLYKLKMDPDDPYFDNNSLWGLTATNTDDAWDTTMGTDVIVAILDTGVDYNHPDISGNLWNAGNGYCGYDFSDNDKNPLDYDDHGTHVAGIIAAVANNGLGIVGVAPEVKLMAVKVFPNAYSSVLAQGMRYAADNGADIINNSWGPKYRRPDDQLVNNAIDYSYGKGSTIVFSAGNANDDAQYYFGANHPNSITVASVDKSRCKANSSNWGTTIDVAAPGVNIVSLKPGGGYQYMSGTSMAAPHVSGLAALIKANNPDYTNHDILIAIQETALPISEPLFFEAGFMDSLGAVSWGSGTSQTTPVITNVPNVNQGSDIFIYGKKFDSDIAMAVITGNGLNEYLEIISRSSIKIRALNNFNAGNYKIQVCNNNICGNLYSFRINYVEPPEEPMISEIQDVEENDDIVIHGNSFEVDKLVVEISGNGVFEEAKIKFACSTAIKVENEYNQGEYDIVVYNGNVQSVSFLVTVYNEGALPQPVYTTVNGSNDVFEWVNGNHLDNKINGYSGVNYIFGREGNDLLRGGPDRDIYMYGPGHGNDIIEDPSGEDIIILNNIDPADVTYVCEGKDYIIYLPNGSITIKNQFGGSAVESLSYW